MKSSANDVPDPTQPDLPGGPARTAVSLWLCIHLFAVFVVLSGNVMRSPLQNRLISRLRPYTRLLLLDPDLTPYQLTHGTDVDVDNFFEIELDDAEGQTHITRLPDSGFRGSQKYKRYQALAKLMASLVSEEEEDGVAWLGRGVGGHVLAVHGSDRGVLRLRQHMLQSIDAAASLRDNQNDPFHEAYYRTHYEADVLRDPDTGEINLNKKYTTGEVAPTETGE